MNFKNHLQRLLIFLKSLFAGNGYEKSVLVFIILTLAIGLWHGFPFTNVVADESFFSGAVLRAIDNHSVMPLPLDVPYGTITYYVNYVFISVSLVVLWIFKGFDLLALKLLIINNVFLIYLVSRFVSFILAVGCLLGLNHILKRYVVDYRSRLFVVFMVFETLLVSVVFHTSKVWILSTVLMVISFYFLNLAMENDALTKKYSVISIITAFLAFANFPLMGFCLINIPLLIYFYRKDKRQLKVILLGVMLGFIIAALIMLSNFSGISAQIESIFYNYTFSPAAMKNNASLGLSAYLHLKKIVLMFPLLLIITLIVLLFNPVKHRNLFKTSIIYGLLYLIVLIYIDRWSLTDKAALRYFFPLPFAWLFFLASFDFGFKKVFYIPVVISLIYIVPTLYLLSVQTTSYKAVNDIREKFSSDIKAVFINNVGADTEVPQNKAAYLLTKKNECGSLCLSTIKYDLQKDFIPIVLNSHTEPLKFTEAIKNTEFYTVEREASSSPLLLLVAKYTNPVTDLNYYSLDNTGSYFDTDYFFVRNYGPNIYIYKHLNTASVKAKYPIVR